MARITPKEFRERLKNANVKLKAKSGFLLNVECKSCCHQWSTNITILRNHSCKHCAAKKMNLGNKTTLREAKQIFKAANVTLLSKYDCATSDIIVVCMTCEHEWKTKTTRLKKYSCIKCAAKKRAAKRKYSPEKVSELLAEVGVEYISGYVNSQSPIKVRHLACGHITKHQRLYNLRKGDGCSECFFIDESDYRAHAAKHGGTLVQMAHKAEEKSVWRCKNGCTFRRSYKVMRANNTFCNKCSRKLAERFCRAVFEALFDAEFESVRLDELRGVGGGKLELDMFNGGLNIAIEHQGLHHYSSRNAWDTDQRLARQQEHDRRKVKYCKEKGIALFVIPEIFTLTPLGRLAGEIEAQAKKLGIILPKSPQVAVEQVDIISLKPESILLLETFLKQLDAASYEFLDTGWRGAHFRHQLRCDKGHNCKIAPDKFSLGRRCGECFEFDRGRGVVLSDGRIFPSVTQCAEDFGVSTGTVSSACWDGHRLGSTDICAVGVSSEEFVRLENDADYKRQLVQAAANRLAGLRPHKMAILLRDGRLFASQLELSEHLQCRQNAISAAIQREGAIKRYKARHMTEAVEFVTLEQHVFKDAKSSASKLAALKRKLFK